MRLMLSRAVASRGAARRSIAGVPDFEAMAAIDQRSGRRERVASARLYLVCPPTGTDARGLANLLRGAIAGGVDIVQLREKHLADDALSALAQSTAALCAQLGALFIVNDRPAVARDAGADGVHVGQDDMPVAEVRELVGPDMLIGLSTHARGEIDAVDAALVDYIGVGPVHETPTKPGRPAVGLELIRYAAVHAPVPFFAIGGLDAGNVVEAIDAGASRICVLRAISDAEDPTRAARALRGLLDGGADGALP
jgi:thiamine-phosphate pyrophosphorylase